jgi:hypothetical protein
MRLFAHQAAVLFLCAGASLVAPRSEAQEKKPPADSPPAKPGLNEDLRKELLNRTKEDQDARKAMIATMNQKGTSPEQAKQGESPLAKRLEAIDRANTARMKEIVDKYGWPGKSLVGKDGANAAWLLVQHADLDPAFQKRCLELIGAAFKKGEVSGQELAYLTDRVRVAQGEKQLYGTQFHTVDGKLVPQPIEDEANVDKRRKEVGLSSMAEYEKLMHKVYKAQDKK